MKKMSLAGLFIHYIRENLKFLTSLLLIFVIFITVFSLNHIDISYVLYALLLCVSALFVFGAAYFYFYVKNYRKLEESVFHITLSLDFLPEPKKSMTKNTPK